VSYLFHAFMKREPPSAQGTKEYLLEGALFDGKPKISFELSPAGQLQSMHIDYDPKRKPMTLRRLDGEEAEAARGEVADQAGLWCSESVVQRIEAARIVLEWEVDRSELTKDAWFALHLWQIWVLKPARGMLYAPEDGIFDGELRRLCGPR